MSTILDWTLLSVSVAGIHLLDFKENFPEWNHYTAKQSVHLLLPLYLKLSINIWAVKCWIWQKLQHCTTRQRSSFAKLLVPKWKSCLGPLKVLRSFEWEQTKTWMFTIMCAFCWHQCFNMWIAPMWSMPKIRGKVIFKDLYCGQHRFRIVLFHKQLHGQTYIRKYTQEQ